MEPVLSVKNLSFSYDGASETLSDVSFDVDAGDYIALAGPNGSGKTTLIKTVLGLEKKYTGSVEIFGKNFAQFSDWGRLGYLPQRVNVFNPLFPATAQEVVGLGLLSQKNFPKKFNRRDQEKIRQTLELMDVADLKNRPVNELSGGQQQRVFLARALVSGPDLLFLDEPTTALDPNTRDRFFEVIKKLNREKGATIILITHDTSHIGRQANKLLYLDKTIVFYGPFHALCQSAEMEKYFGHHAQHLICHQHNN